MATTQNNTTQESPYIFLRRDDDYDADRVLVAKRDWFEKMPVCETYGDYGIKAECETAEENGECCCSEVLAYNYWNGSNHASVIIESENFDTFYSIVDDEAEVARYEQALKDKEEVYPSETRTGYKDWELEDFTITQSYWQGDWELYTITERE